MEDTLTSGLNKSIAAIKTASVANMVTAAMLIQADSQRITPVDTTHLIKSAYTNPVVTEANGLSVEIGYWASYAPFVHESPETTNWKKPTAENKFLEKSLMKNEKKVLAILGAVKI